MSKKTSLNDFFSDWGGTETPATKGTAQGSVAKSTPKSQTPAGRTGGRTTQAGRGGRGGGRGIPQDSTISDPWADEKLEKPTFDEETEGIVRELLNRPTDQMITEEDTAMLKPRVAMQVLMVLFADRGNEHFSAGSRTQLAHRIRYRNEKWVREMLNDPAKLENEVSLMSITAENKALNSPWTAPLEFTDLVNEETRLEFAKAKTSTEKRNASMEVLKQYFMRNFEQDEKLMALYNEMGNLSLEHLLSVCKHRGALLKIIYKKGKEGPRFIPLDIPSNDFRTQKPPPAQQEESKKAAKRKRKQAKQEVEEEEVSSKNTFSEFDGFDDEEQPDEQVPPPPTTPTPIEGEKLSVSEAAERFKKGLEQPDTAIEINQEKLRSLGEDELRDYLTQILTPYLVEHYSSNAERLLAKLGEMNNFGIVDTITTANAMSKIAESMGIAPADRFNTGSSMKVKGNPLSSNVHRVYELRCTKAEVGRGTVKTFLPMIVGKLFPLVASMGGHSIKLIPFNPNSLELDYWDHELVEKNAETLPGVYAVNIISHPWNDRLMWDCKVVTTLDLNYLLNRSNSRGSNQCGAFQHFLQQNKFHLQIIHQNESMKRMIAVIMRSSLYDEEKKCLTEIVERLQATGFSVHESQMELRWQAVTLPSNETLNTVMRSLYAEPVVAEKLQSALIRELNKTTSRILYPRTWDWKFYRNVEDDEAFSLREGIARHIEYSSDIISITVTGLSGYDLLDHVPKANGRNKRLKGSVQRTLLNPEKFWKNSAGEWIASPFYKIFRRSWDQYIFVGHKNRFNTMQTFLVEGGFAYYLQACFKETGIEQNWPAITVHGHNPEGSESDESFQSNGVDQLDDELFNQIEDGERRDRTTEQDTVGISTLTQSTKPKSPGRSVERFITQENDPQPPPQFQMGGFPPPPQVAYGAGVPLVVNPSIYVPPIQGQMGQRELELLINNVASQLKAQQAASLEAALRILDPASAFGRVLEHRDKERDGEMMDFMYNSVWLCVEHAVEEALQRFVESDGKYPSRPQDKSTVTGITSTETQSAEEGSESNPTKDPTKLPQPHQNPETANNDDSIPPQQEVMEEEIDPGEVVEPAAIPGNLATPKSDGKAEYSKFHTPATSELTKMVSQSFKESIDHLEEEMDKRKLSFDNFASTLSPINDDSKLSASTQKLKMELDQTRELDDWEDRVTGGHEASPSNENSNPVANTAEAVGQQSESEESEDESNSPSPQAGLKSPDSIASRLKSKPRSYQSKNEKDTT